MRPVLLVLVAAALTLAACGGDDSAEKTTPTPEASTDLSAIKTYLLDHTQRLSRDVATMKENAQQYHDLAEQSGFDTKKLLADHQRGGRQAPRRRQEDLRRRQPGLRGDGGRRGRRARRSPTTT